MSEYDYVVVGSGSGGAVLAGRLSEDPGVSVLVLEAGGRSRPHLNVQIPAAFAKQFHTALDWDYESEPEPHLDGRRIYQPRGRMLGGTSGMNAMIYIRGNRADYDGWAKAGATGWSYDEVLPLFRRMETNSRGASEFHGASGPQYVEDAPDPREGSRRLVEAMVEVGLGRTDDFNGAQQEGASLYQRFTHRGSRWTTYDGYLAPHRKRPNLTIRPRALVHRVTIENGRATGVLAKVDGTLQTIRARREVILAAGAYNTPQLLMLSGIGPADHLAEHGITTLVDNPHVGAHLMDHPMYLVNWDSSHPDNLASAEKPAELVRYLLRHRGMLTSNIGEAGAFFHSSVADDAPALQLIGAPVYFWQHGAATYHGKAIAIGVSLVGARSEGTVRLASADPERKVRIRNDYFAHPDDLTSMVEGIERAREVLAAPALKDFANHEIHPGPRFGSARADLEQAVREGVEHTYHPSCTARMGTESGAAGGVLDAALRVYGVAGLRVADASAMPRVTHGNTHAPTMLIGEKAADLLTAGS
ncbi:GMC family oxidoreductase [Nocardioides nitrophenolicus]|uniref:GMC family oxidoreductase n=1 Tax=Nocardioides nitrophenolicus TaxID=60489 RepID=UPI00195E8F9C|nr:GMC family oxidoreductase N-terminal domain-containing protein [Nocardioides nitrophenolicus]MBM7515594.1 choline dehydrogenase-like flavoprotein [Nocardioides nitrophenolicus]